jgi:hypothetical protein|uniref:Uncharacterized protein n=1 Tax=Siphoviridae sp. ctGuJ10 TaxID=2825418 RepID=A0A8S5PTB3_9CAUD|nr:MAG TPA: hypothetical protein [Siphoviridae sp. ctGuJ10]
MKIGELFRDYSNQEIPQSTLKLFGIEEPTIVDKMLSADEVSIVINTTSKAYDIIRRLKAKYSLSYDESRIPASILCQEYHMNVVEMLNYLEHYKQTKKSPE